MADKGAVRRASEIIDRKDKQIAAQLAAITRLLARLHAVYSLCSDKEPKGGDVVGKWRSRLIDVLRITVNGPDNDRCRLEFRTPDGSVWQVDTARTINEPDGCVVRVYLTDKKGD